MPTFLDDEPVGLAGATLGDVLDAARDRVQPARRLVVEVQLDGRLLTGDELEARRGAPVGGEEVRLYTAEAVELALNTLRQLGARLADARAAQAEAAALFQQDQPAEGMRRVARVVEVWQQTQQAVLLSANLTGISLDAHRFEGRAVGAFVEELLARIRGLRDLIAGGDTVALADALAYEWPEVIDRWERLIGDLLGWIEREGR